MSNRAILYLRSSKDRSDVSIDAQRRALHELAVESGKDDDRPAFQRLISELKRPARAWEHVLVLDTSRIARRRLISMLFESDCAKQGVRLVYRSLPESDPATDMVLRSVLQAFDEYHSLISRAKGLAGMAENVRQGWRAGGRAPRGYRLEYHATGAMRDGAPVTKSRLVIDDELAPKVQAYLRLRAAGVPRGTAISRLQLQWPTNSTHSMDWQALTYAGHTVWNVHADAAVEGAGEKRRPRSQWLITRDTHPALITEVEAEAILGQVERALQGRRLRESPLLFTGLLQAPGGAPWHSDGCGYYRLASGIGKGRKIGAARIEGAVLERLAQDLSSDEAVARLVASMRELAARLDDPAPVLRRVRDLEHARANLIDELAELRARGDQLRQAEQIGPEQVRALLCRLLAQIREAASESETRAAARVSLHEVLERIELDVAASSVRLHYAVLTGDKVASPRGFEPLLQP
jgi:site-specific DNA recombinase